MGRYENFFIASAGASAAILGSLVVAESVVNADDADPTTRELRTVLSVISHNYDSGNTGGVLITDEFGPTHNNLVEDNIVTENQYDCGITVPGHNPFAVDAHGNPQPTMAGVFDNVIRRNVVTEQRA